MLCHNCTDKELIDALRQHADTCDRFLNMGDDGALGRAQLLGGSVIAIRRAADKTD